MPEILLVDDDHDTWEAVRLALEPDVQVHAIESLSAALEFLRTRASDVSGVIVDLNLTEGSDNFGRTVLERLRDMGVPCVVFSSSIRTPADAARYANEFGVLGTIGKAFASDEAESPLFRLRENVALMCKVSLDRDRARVRADVDRELNRRVEAVARERDRSTAAIEETERVAGRGAARRLAESERSRLDGLDSDERALRERVTKQIDRASSVEDLAEARIDIMGSLGAG